MSGLAVVAGKSANARQNSTAGDGEGVGKMRMTRIGTKGMAAAVALLALSCPVQGWAITSQASGIAIGTANMVVAQAAAGGDQAAPAAADAGGLSDATKQGVGCLAGAGASLTYAAYVAGATETLMIAAGGLLAPSATPTLWLGLTATLAAATCAMGAAATPAVLWAVEQKDNISANLSYQAKAFGDDVLQASNTLAATLFAATPAEPGARLMAERPEGAR